MSKRNFLVCSAKYIFVLASVVIMSMAFSACSKDDKDDGPQLKANVLTVGNREAPVKKVVCYKNDEGIYKIKVFFDDDEMEEVRFIVKEDLYFNKKIDLSKKKDADSYWEVMYDDPTGSRKIDTWSKPDHKYGEGEEIYPVFEKGSLFITKKSADNIYIKLEGRVEGTTKGVMYDISLLYQGKMTVVTD